MLLVFFRYSAKKITMGKSTGIKQSFTSFSGRKIILKKLFDKTQVKAYLCI